MDSARYYLRQGKEIAERTQDFYGKLEASSLEGEIYKTERRFRPARKAFLDALEMAKEADLVTNEMDLYRGLAEISQELGDYQNAYSYYVRHNELKDSLFNVKKINEIANIEFTYQVDKQAREDSLKQVQIAMLIAAKEKQDKYIKERKNTLEFSGIAFFILIIFLIILMNRRLKMSDKVLNLLIFIFFVIIFEASLVAFDPLIDLWSKGEVAVKVVFNSGLAFAIFTAHHFLEGRMSRMIRRN